MYLVYRRGQADVVYFYLKFHKKSPSVNCFNMSFSPATQYLTEEESILHWGLYWMCMRISGRTCPRRVKLAQSWIWIFCVERGRASGRYALQFVGNFFLYFPWLHSLTTRYDIKSLLAYKMNSAFLYIEGHAFVEFIAVYSWLRRYFTRL